MAKTTKGQESTPTTPETEASAPGNGGTPPPGTNLPATTQAAPTLDEYRQVFAPARDAMIAKLEALSASLTDAPKAAVEQLIKSANPHRKGREEMESRWLIPTIRLVQGMTKEKPDKAVPGDLFTTSGYILPQPFKVTPLYTFQANRMFPESGGGGNKAPVCFAPDAKYGKPFGECLRCANLPLGQNAAGAITDCDNGLCFVVLSEDLKLYRMEFFKTSRKAGVRMDQLSAACDNIWERWFTIKTQTQTGGGNEWSVFRVAAAGEDTPPHIRAAADILYDLIHAERKVFLKLYYDSIARGDAAAAGVNEQVDLNAMGMNTEAGGDNPDLSDGGI